MVTPTKEEIFSILDSVKDPEIDVLSVVELGIIREVEIEAQTVTVTITPTYSGCPAMQVIEEEVKKAIESHGFKAKIKITFSPPWTTDWMEEEAKEKLRKYGISAPFKESQGDLVHISAKSSDRPVCPQCRSEAVELVNEFGSTACKSLYKCLDCQEPFDKFKCH